MHRQLPHGTSILIAATLAGWGAQVCFGADSQQRPVIVELFTSQGCSSCPPAEALLTRLDRPEDSSSQIIPLAYHVDYWNDLGWRDPFSDANWTKRQQTYARILPARVYTPQLIINGRQETVGSDELRIRREVVAAQRLPTLGQVTLMLSHLEAGARRLTLQIRVQRDPALQARQLLVMVATCESALATSVTSGENSGHVLQNDFVVRRLEPLFSLSPKTGESEERRIIMELDPAWNVAHLRIAAFLQDAANLEIYGAAVQDVLTTGDSS